MSHILTDNPGFAGFFLFYLLLLLMGLIGGILTGNQKEDSLGHAPNVKNSGSERCTPRRRRRASLPGRPSPSRRRCRGAAFRWRF
jgi:hypothetical protein